MAATNIAKLSVLFSSDARQFDKGIKKSLGAAGKRFAAFSKKVALAGAGAATAIGGIIKSTASAADSLAKTSRKLGITIDELAGLRHAGEQTGVSMQTMDMAVQRMTRRVAEAAQGTGEAVKALQELGLSADELNKAGPAEAMRLIAEAMKDVDNQGDKVRLAMKLFDSEGVALVNTLGIGADGLREMQDEAVALGLSFDEVDAKKFEEFNDDIDVIRKQFVGLRNTLAVELLPVVQSMVGSFEDLSLANRGKAFADGWRSALALAIGHFSNFEASIVDFVGRTAQHFADLIGKFPGIVDGVKTAIQGTINFVIYGVEGLINSVIASINLLNAGISKLPFVRDFGEVGSVSLDKVELPGAEALESGVGGFAKGNAAEAAKLRAQAEAAFATADEFAAAMNETIDTGRKASEAATNITAETIEGIDRVVEKSGGGTKAAADAATDAIKDMTREATVAEQQISRVWDRTMDDMGSALTGMITDGRTQWSNFGDWFKAWTASTVAEYIADWATGMAKRIAMEAAMTGAKSSVGWVSSLSKAFLGPQSSYFGGGNLTGKARGGAVSGSVPYMVGERGPEVVIPGSNGSVVPNHKLGGGGGGIVINQNFSAGVSEAQLFEAARTTYEAAKTGVAEAVARGGGYRRQLQY